MSKQYTEGGTRYIPSSMRQGISLGLSLAFAISALYFGRDALYFPEDVAVTEGGHSYDPDILQGVGAGILGLVSLSLFLSSGASKPVIEGVPGVDYKPEDDERN